MIIEIIIFGILCYFVWKRKEKIEANNYSIHVRTLFYLPIIQFLLCSLFCSISFIFDENLPQDEINKLANEHELMNDFSTVLFGIDFRSDQVSSLLLIENLHSQVRYVLTGSFIIYAIQIYSTYKKQFNPIIIEGITILHSLLIFYIGNLVGESLVFLMNQLGTVKVINAISNNSYFEMYGLVVIWLIPFHYLFHLKNKKYYCISE